MKKSVSETLVNLADQIHAARGADSDWWRGYVAGIRRAASLIEAYEAFEETRGG